MTMSTLDYEIHEPAMLFVTYLRDRTQLSVYRSPIVRDSDPMYQPVTEIVGDAEPTSRFTVDDPDMLLGRGELSIYEIATTIEQNS